VPLIGQYLNSEFSMAKYFLLPRTYPINAFKTNAVIMSLPPKSRTWTSCKKETDDY
jgi:hypothetical protein